MKAREAYDWLLERSIETSRLDSVRSLLHWDQGTCLPPRGQSHRVEQIALVSRLIHDRLSDPVTADMLREVESSDMLHDSLSIEAVNTREWRRSYDRESRIPQRLAIELATAASSGELAWQKFRPQNDWEGFKPYLERIVSLKREEASCVGIGDEAYDSLLDEYEPGETARSAEALLGKLRAPLVDLLERIRESPRKPDRSVIGRSYQISKQEELGRLVAAAIGYDMEGGRLSVSAHPFSSSIGPGDVRITTRYDVANFAQSFFSTVHESGHAIYEQGLPAEYWGTPIGRVNSLGLHESQSRTWENLVAKSRGFWRHFYPIALARFSGLSDVTLDAFYFAVNEVKASHIRTEADEVTYNLHIMLRFELELAMLRGGLQVGDLPGAWREKTAEYLQLEVPDHSRGVMQDVHWSGGSIGYFPTYTLGNIYSAQFFRQAEKELGNLGEMFARGEFQEFLNWLRRNIHSQGSRYPARELVKVVTGSEVDPTFLIDYLRQKYGELYDL